MMVNAWWLVIEATAFIALCIACARANYRCGIWDGAFNHFLPIVQQEMIEYDPYRAAEILAADRAREWELWVTSRR